MVFVLTSAIQIMLATTFCEHQIEMWSRRFNFLPVQAAQRFSHVRAILTHHLLNLQKRLQICPQYQYAFKSGTSV